MHETFFYGTVADHIKLFVVIEWNSSFSMFFWAVGAVRTFILAYFGSFGNYA